MTSEYYDRDLTPIDGDTWARLHQQDDYKIVEKTTSPDDSPWDRTWEVSTVWLGLNHAWEPGEILVFETLVFGGPLDELMRRYRTERDARQGHMQMVRLCQATDHNMAAMYDRTLDQLQRIFDVADTFHDTYGDQTSLDPDDVAHQLVDAYERKNR